MKIFSAMLCQLARGVTCAALLPGAATAAGWELSSAFSYDTGKYGYGNRTDSVYMPFTLKRSSVNAGLSVTIPLLRQSSSGLLTRVGGRPVRSGRGGGAVEHSPQSGLGDILLRGTYTLKPDGPGSVGLALAGRLKLPTASKHKKLGTGEMDEGVGLELAKKINARLTLLAEGTFTIIGDPDGEDLNNEVAVQAGFCTLLLDKLGLTVLYAAQSAIVDGNADPRSVSGTLSYGAGAGLRLSGGVTLGLSAGSPDLGLGAACTLQF